MLKDYHFTHLHVVELKYEGSGQETVLRLGHMQSHSESSQICTLLHVLF